jgi:hypothetical protein
LCRGDADGRSLGLERELAQVGGVALGDLGQGGALVRAELQHQPRGLARVVQPLEGVEVVPAALGDDAGLYGAAAMVL